MSPERHGPDPAIRGVILGMLGVASIILSAQAAEALEWQATGRAGLETGTSAWDPLTGALGTDLETMRPWLANTRGRLLADAELDCLLDDWMVLRAGIGGRLASATMSGSNWSTLATAWCEGQAIALPGDLDLTVAYSHRNTFGDQSGHTLWAMIEKPMDWGAVLFLDGGHDWNLSSDPALMQMTPFTDLGISKRVGPWGTRFSLAVGGSRPMTGSGSTGLGAALTGGLSQVVTNAQVVWMRLRLDGYSPDGTMAATWGPSFALGTAWLYP